MIAYLIIYQLFVRICISIIDLVGNESSTNITMYLHIRFQDSRERECAFCSRKGLNKESFLKQTSTFVYFLLGYYKRRNFLWCYSDCCTWYGKRKRRIIIFFLLQSALLKEMYSFSAESPDSDLPGSLRFSCCAYFVFH